MYVGLPTPTCKDCCRGWGSLAGRFGWVMLPAQAPPPDPAGLITADTVKSGAILLDVGISRNADGRLVGDVDDAAREAAAWNAPMPVSAL
jgi:hypothetical protein